MIQATQSVMRVGEPATSHANPIQRCLVVGAADGEADEIEHRIDDPDRERQADLAREGQRRVVEGTAFGIDVDPILVYHVGHHRTQEQVLGAEVHADHHVDQQHPAEALGRHHEQRSRREGRLQRRIAQGPMLAEALAQTDENRHAQEPREKQHHQVQARRLRQQEHLRDEEEVHRSVDSPLYPEQKIGEQDPAQAAVLEHRTDRTAPVEPRLPADRRFTGARQRHRKQDGQ